MKLSIAIVGLPNVGKSTLFKALTKNDITIANYPFATIDPNVGVVSVPDERLKMLTKISNSKKTIPAIVEFYDIAGLVRGANKGEGLGNKFLAHIRETQAVAMVVRCFPDPEIIHVEQGVDPIRDIEIINTELIFKDLETIEKRFKKAETEARSGDKKAKELLTILQTLQKELSTGKLANQTNIDPEKVSDLGLLTLKKQIYILNGRPDDIDKKITDSITARGAAHVQIDLSQPEPDLTGLIKAAYQILGLISFFTTGEDETRAWTISQGAKAPQAAGTIHTDFEQKFIRAEVIAYPRLVDAGGWLQAKTKGWLRLEGKEYVVQDGDVLVIRHG
jgi:ribosome-binding ATPase